VKNAFNPNASANGPRMDHERYTLRHLTERLGSPSLRTIVYANDISEHRATWPCGCIGLYERVGDVDWHACAAHA
jgi:hypothetical protein